MFHCRESRHWHAGAPATPSACLALPADKNPSVFKVLSNRQLSRRRKTRGLSRARTVFYCREILQMRFTRTETHFICWRVLLQRCSLFPGEGLDSKENWCSQVNRLQQLLDKLECQVGRRSTAPASCVGTQRHLGGGGVC